VAEELAAVTSFVWLLAASQLFEVCFGAFFEGKGLWLREVVKVFTDFRVKLYENVPWVLRSAEEILVPISVKL
jgi:hypothetical protein